MNVRDDCRPGYQAVNAKNHSFHSIWGGCYVHDIEPILSCNASSRILIIIIS